MFFCFLGQLSAAEAWTNPSPWIILLDFLTFDTSASLLESVDIGINTALSSELVTSEVSEDEVEIATDITDNVTVTHVLCDEAIQ